MRRPRPGRFARCPVWFLGVCVLFYAVSNTIWWLLDDSSPSYDRAAHAGFALEYLRLFEAPTRLSLTKLLTVTQYWPPFFHVCSVPFTMALGFSLGSVAATNLLFLLAAAYGIYRVGSRLFDAWVGVGAVALTLLYPGVYSLSRLVLLDFALMAMVALSVEVILSTDAGLRLRRAWWLGVAVGAAMLTKWTAVTFLLGPWMFWLVLAIKRDRLPVRQVARSLAIAAVAAVVVALPWYTTASGEFLRGAGVAFGSDPLREGDPTGLVESLRSYWEALPDLLMLTPLLAATITGVAAFVAWSRARVAAALLLAWIVPPVVFFLLIPNKDARFILPALPAVALLAAAGIRACPWRAARSAAWTFILVVGLYQFVAISFGWPVGIAHFYGHPPSRQDWKVNEILTDLAALKPRGSKLVVGFLPNDPDFEPNIFQLAVAVRKLPIAVEGIGFFQEPIQAWRRYDVIVSKTGSISVSHAVARREVFRDELRAWVASGTGDPAVTLWRRWPLPDGSEAEAYLVTPGLGGG